MLAFAISSILTGIAFYSLGAMRLGSLSEFFPRHILVGCIGGVGAFLFITGLVRRYFILIKRWETELLLSCRLQVSARLDESSGFSFSLVQHFFEAGVLPLWVSHVSLHLRSSGTKVRFAIQLIPLGLAVTLRLITSRWSHPLIFPGYFLAIPIVFYAIALSLGKTVPQLRDFGWIFEVNGVDSEWYEFWTLFGLPYIIMSTCGGYTH